MSRFNSWDFKLYMKKKFNLDFTYFLESQRITWSCFKIYQKYFISFSISVLHKKSDKVSWISFQIFPSWVIKQFEFRSKRVCTCTYYLSSSSNATYTCRFGVMCEFIVKSFQSLLIISIFLLRKVEWKRFRAQIFLKNYNNKNNFCKTDKNSM